MNIISKVALSWFKQNNTDAKSFIEFQPSNLDPDLYYTFMVEGRGRFPKVTMFFNVDEWIFQYGSENVSYEEIPQERRGGHGPMAVMYIKNQQLSEIEISCLMDQKYRLENVVALPEKERFLYNCGDFYRVENEGDHIELYIYV